eukprot:tig00021504_g21969.t1
MEIKISIPDGPSAAVTNGTLVTCNGTTYGMTAGQRSLVVTGLLPGSLYTCEAVLDSPAGRSEPSDSEPAAGRPGSQPTPVQLPKASQPSVTVKDVNSTAVVMRVMVPVVGGVQPKTIRVYRASSGGAEELVAEVAAATETQLADAGRTPGTLYTYSAEYTTQGEPSSRSDWVAGRTAPSAPALTPTVQSATNVTFAIASPDATSPPLSIEHVQATAVLRNGTAVGACSRSGAVTECTDTGVYPGLVYVYTVQYKGLGVGGTVLESTGDEHSLSGVSQLTVKTDVPPAPELHATGITDTTSVINAALPTDGSASTILKVVVARFFEGASTTWELDKGAPLSQTERPPGSTATYTAYFTTNGASSATCAPYTVTQLPPATPTITTLLPPDTSSTSLTATVVFASDLPRFVTAIRIWRDSTELESIAITPSGTGPLSYSLFDTLLAPGKQYTYTARLVTQYADSAEASASKATAQALAPTVDPTPQSATAVNVAVSRGGADAGRIDAASLTITRSGENAGDSATEHLSGAGPWTWSDVGLVAGRLYTYTATYATRGQRLHDDGADSLTSTAISVRTAPSAPSLSLCASSAAVNVTVGYPSDATSDVSYVLVYRSPQWGGLGSKACCNNGGTLFADSEVSPGATYSYTAKLVTSTSSASEGVDSALSSPAVNITTAPKRPSVQSGDKTKLKEKSVEIEIHPAEGWEGAERINVYRSDGAVYHISIGSLARKVKSGKTVYTWEDRDESLKPGSKYTYRVELETPAYPGSCSVKSGESGEGEVWTAVPAPQPVVQGTSASPSATVSVPLPTDGNSSAVEVTKCRRAPSTDYFVVTDQQFSQASADGIDHATTYTYYCIFEGKGGTVSEEGLVTVTTPPDRPVLNLVPLNSTSMEIKISIPDGPSAAVTNGMLVTCNGTTYGMTAGQRSLVVTGLLPGSLHTCEAVLDSPAGRSEPSDSEPAAGRPGSQPTPVQLPKASQPSVTVKNVNSTAVVMRVMVPVVGGVQPKTIRVYRASSGGAEELVAEVAAATETQLADAGRTPGTLYTYSAEYTTQGEPSSRSDWVAGRTAPSAPALTPTVQSATNVTFAIASPDATSPPLSIEHVQATAVLRNGTAYKGLGVGGTVLESTGDEHSLSGVSQLTVKTDVPPAPELHATGITDTTSVINAALPTDGSASTILKVVVARFFEGASTTWELDKGAPLSQTERPPGSTATYTAYFTTNGASSATCAPYTVTQLPPATPTITTLLPPDTSSTSLTATVVFASDLPRFVTAIRIWRDSTELESIAITPSGTGPLSYSLFDTLLAPGKQYTYTARLVTQYADSAEASASKATAQALAPTVDPTPQSATAVNVAVSRGGADAGRIDAASLTITRSGENAGDSATKHLSGAGPWTWSDVGLVAGRLYTYTATYATRGQRLHDDGADSLTSTAISVRTAPSAPSLSLCMSSAAVNVTVGYPSDATSDVSYVLVYRSPQWGGLGSKACCNNGGTLFADSEVSPGATYSYTAKLVTSTSSASEGVESALSGPAVNITTAPKRPSVQSGDKTKLKEKSVEIEIHPAEGWEGAELINVYRSDGAVYHISIGSLARKVKSGKTVYTWEDRDESLKPGSKYTYRVELETPPYPGSCSVKSGESGEGEVWTAVPAPQPVVQGTSASPLATVSVPLPTDGNSSAVEVTKCRRAPSTDYFVVTDQQFSQASADGIDHATTYTYYCIFEGKGGTVSEEGLVTVTTPPMRPEIAIDFAEETAFRATISVAQLASWAVSNGTIVSPPFRFRIALGFQLHRLL